MKIIKPSRKNDSKTSELAEVTLTLKKHNEVVTQESSSSKRRQNDSASTHSLDVFTEEFERVDGNHQTVTSPSLRPGAEKNQQRQTKSEYQALMHKAIYLLSMREHSVQELTDKLINKTNVPSTVDSVMDFLIANDYVSDVRFAEAFVRARANKGQGPIKIRSELRSKGVGVQIIDDSLDPNAAVWIDNAANLYHKKYGDEPVSDYNAWSKRARFMQSRGFTMEHIHSTVPQVEYD